MLRSLIESKPVRARNRKGALVSGVVHLMLIGGAAYATSSAATPPAPPEPTRLQFLKPHAAASPNRKTSQSSPAVSPAVSSLPSVALSISPNLPAIDIQLGSTPASDFPASRQIEFAAPGSPGLSAPAKAVYEAADVESQVAAIAGSGVPDYPASLRAAGIEGSVIAHFVVDQDGRAVPGTIRISSSTNELFSASVKRAISRMSFVPARLNGKPVSQMVQQLFVFKLDR